MPVAALIHPKTPRSIASMLRRDKFLAARDKFVARLGGANRLDEVADDLRNIVPSLHTFMGWGTNIIVLIL